MPSHLYIYILFLSATALIYYAVNKKYAIYCLFAASILFISSLSVAAALFSLALAIFNYFIGIFLESSDKRPALKSKLFWLGIVVNVVCLAFFKYIDNLLEGINTLLSAKNTGATIPYLKLIIPIGISYYTFQSLGYLILINRGSEKAEKDFAKFSTFLLFFPKFLSGPVERSNHFFPQTQNLGSFNRDTIASGLRLLLWGVFKKIVIANNPHGMVTNVYADIFSYSGLTLVFVLFIQFIYIYCDFSGYTDMALGSAKIFGIDLLDNFKRPFLAKSVTEFWKRWHISLSSWCNDFIFLPFLVKFRKWGNNAAIAGIFITFFIIGIWHGANWTFVVLGVLQGIALVYEFYTKKTRLKIAGKLPQNMVNTLSRIITFIFMSLSIVFFFANSIREAWHILPNLFVNVGSFSSIGQLIPDKALFLLAIGSFTVLFILEMLHEKGKDMQSIFIKQPVAIRWAGYLACMGLIYLSGSGIEQFYYMRF